MIDVPLFFEINNIKMNRIDRLMNMVLTLQSRPYLSAELLAEKYHLSTRSIYRDIKALQQNGIPVFFEPHKGYCLMEGYFLPPLQFSTEEANALILLQSLAKKFADQSINKNAEQAIEKIKAVLKKRDQEKIEKFLNKVEVYHPRESATETSYLAVIQQAIIDQHTLFIHYKNNNNQSSQRKIDPIGLIFYTNQWHLIAWCWQKKEYRDFKIPMIGKLVNTREPFEKTHTFTIQDYLKIF